MRKVLVVAYYWPPAGGPGVQRWLAFARHLPAHGIEPLMYVPSNPVYPILDPTLASEEPLGIRVLKRPIREPAQIARWFAPNRARRLSAGIIGEERRQGPVERILLAIRGNLFIPDARVLWVRPSVAFLERFLAENGIDAVVTTGPPHSLHLIGKRLKDKMGIRWIADFRDPWTGIGYHDKLHMGRSAARKHEKWEERILRSADGITVTSAHTKSGFQSLTDRPIAVVTNGYEPFEGDGGGLDRRFSMAHFGSLLSGRNPGPLWDVLSELVREHADFARDLEIKLVGTVSEGVRRSLEERGLSDMAVFPGYLDHAAVRAQQASAQLLLLLEIDSSATQGILPGKLFEYMASGRPILAIGPQGWEAGAIVEETASGRAFVPDDRDSLRTYIWGAYQAFSSGSPFEGGKRTEAYTRKAVAGTMAAFMKEIYGTDI